MIMKAMGVAMIAGTASAQVSLTEIGRVDLSATFDSSGLGSNISAVAWDGVNVYAAGFDNFSGNNTEVGIVRVADALGAATQTNFGVLPTPDGRGYSGLAIQRGLVAAAYDDGSADDNGIALYDGATGAQLWNKNARGGSGVGFDPGFAGVDAGVAWTTFGSGRRALQDTATGADIYTTANGAIINAGTGTFWRDMDFNDANGDIYARRSNGIIRGTRTAGNSFSGLTALVPTDGAADFISGHNLEVVNDFGFVIYNDRTSTGSGQGALDVLNVIDLDGNAMTLTLNTISPLGDGVGYYDFSYDAASQTLAVSDFTSGIVHIFAVPAPASAGLMGLAGFAAMRRRR